MTHQEKKRDKSKSLFWIVALGTAAFWMLLIWAVHRDSPRTLVSFHGFIHSAIAERFLNSAPTAFPPENPFFAGRPVCYYWFFQFMAAQLVRLFGWNIFHAFEALILVAMGTLMIVAVGLGRTLYRSTLAGILIGYLIVAGTNPFGWIYAAIKIVSRGVQVLLDNDPHYLWGVVHPLYSLIRYNDVGGLYGPLINFFLNLTSRPAALAGLLGLAFSLQWSLQSHKIWPTILLGCTAAVTTALNPMIGISAGGALVVVLIFSWLWQGFVSKEPNAIWTGLRVRLLVSSLVIIAGILAATPTYYHLLFGPRAGQVQFSLVTVDGLKHLVTVASSIVVLMALALVGMGRVPKDQNLFLRILFFAALLLLAADLALLLPTGNESNFFHAAAVLLAIPAAGSIMRVGSADEHPVASPHRMAIIILVFLPTLVLLMSAYIHRPSLPAEFKSVSLTRLPENSALAHLYQWVQDKTSPDSVFIIDPGRRVAVCGNISEFPAMTGRVIFTEQLSHYLVEPYPDSKTRVDMAVRLASGNEPSDADRAYLRDLHRPAYVVSYVLEDSDAMGRMEHLYRSPVFHQGNISVFKWPN